MADDRQGLADGRPAEVHGDAEPADQRGPGGIESALDETLLQRVVLEIYGHEGEAVRCGDPRGGQQPPLPLLGRRVIYLEDPDLVGQAGAVAERVKAGAEDHVLGDAAPDAVGEAVLGIAAAAGGLGPRRPQDQVRAVGTVITEELLGLISQHRRRQHVREDPRFIIDDQVGCPRGGCGERSLARLFVGIHPVDNTNQYVYHITKRKIA